MKTLSLSLLLFLAIKLQASYMSASETGSGWKIFKSYLSNVQMNIDIKGNYAQIDLTFNVRIDSLNPYYGNGYYYSNLPTYRDDKLEATMNFTMDSGSFFNNAYLWLNDSIVIKAALMERYRANTIYNNIVVRRRDPLILNQNSLVNYEFKVFPISTNYSRKIKLSYLIPLLSIGSETDIVKLPYDIFSQVSTKENINIQIHTGSKYIMSESLEYPSIAPINKIATGYYNIQCSINEFIKSSYPLLQLKRTQAKPISLSYTSIDSISGVYHLKINTRAFSPSNKLSSCSIHIPFNGNGFKTNHYSNLDNFSYSSQFIECGAYYGTFDVTKPFYFYYTDPTGVHKDSILVDDMELQEITSQIWAYFNSLWADNRTAFLLSYKYKFLNRASAYLALETGDTVKQSANTTNTTYSSIEHPENDIPVTFTIGPNPFIYQIDLTAAEPIESFCLFDVNGKLIYAQTNESASKEMKIDLSHLEISDGLYIIKVKIKDVWISRKITKQSH